MLSDFLTPTTESDHIAGDVAREGEMQVLLSLQLVGLSMRSWGLGSSQPTAAVSRIGRVDGSLHSSELGNHMSLHLPLSFG